MAQIHMLSLAANVEPLQPLTYRFGDVELRDQHAAVLELKGLEKLYAMPLGGLLGFDFLSRFVTDIDDVGAATPSLSRRHLPRSIIFERAGDQARTVRKFVAPDVEAFNPTNIRGLIDALTIGDVTLPHVLGTVDTYQRSENVDTRDRQRE